MNGFDTNELQLNVCFVLKVKWGENKKKSTLIDELRYSPTAFTVVYVDI